MARLRISRQELQLAVQLYRVDLPISLATAVAKMEEAGNLTWAQRLDWAASDDWAITEHRTSPYSHLLSFQNEVMQTGYTIQGWLSMAPSKLLQTPEYKYLQGG